MRPRWSVAPLAVGVVCMLALAGCGRSESGSDQSSSKPGTPATSAQKGGTLKVMQASDYDYIDPGLTYYQLTYSVMYAVQRPLFSPKPGDQSGSPDLAESDADISSGGKVLTVKIRKGIMFSPPVSREVKAADVKYAIERGLTKNVPNGYAGAYFGDVIGVKEFQAGKAKDVAGIETPDDYTLVMRFEHGGAGYAVGALSLPISAPVPREYAQKFDRQSPSTYGMHQVATGPYMFEADSSGKVTGYKPGRSATLVRNPNWKADTDFRPAYVDRIEVTIGADPNVFGKQILQGQDMIGVESPTAADVKSALHSRKDQIVFTAGGSNRYVAMNTTIPPFNNVNLRRAIAAALDKQAMLLTRGGGAVGFIATHIIPPGIPGFDDAGGMKGKWDFMQQTDGNADLAASYMKKAGFPSGKYTGGDTVLMVADDEGAEGKMSQIVLQTFQKLGFKVQFRPVQRSTMFTKFCNVPKAQVAVCPNVGWIKDFSDGLNFLDLTFNGENIAEQNNSNWPQFNDPKINKEIDDAKLIVDPAERAKRAGEIDEEISGLAPAVPWVWDKQGSLRSANVNGVIATWNQSWDVSFTSLK